MDFRLPTFDLSLVAVPISEVRTLLSHGKLSSQETYTKIVLNFNPEPVTKIGHQYQKFMIFYNSDTFTSHTPFQTSFHEAMKVSRDWMGVSKD